MKKALITFSLVTVIAGGFFGFKYLNSTKTNTQEIPVIEASASFIDDFSDKRKLSGAVHNIFVGKVIEQTGTKALGQTPETQFIVEVTDNIKGNLSGKVIVNQQGGYYEDEDGQKKLVRFEGDNLLQPGSTYLFATRYLQSENWNTLVPKVGDIPIDGEVTKANLIKTFKDAFKNEIKPEVLKVIDEKK